MVEKEKHIYYSALDELNDIKEIVNTNKTSKFITYLLKYSIIVSSSALEQMLKQIIYRILTKGVNPYAEKFIEQHFLNKTVNPNSNNLINLVNKVGINISKKFQTGIKEKYFSEREQLDALIHNRNMIAHTYTGISMSIDNIINAYRCGVKLILFLECLVKHQR